MSQARLVLELRPGGTDRPPAGTIGRASDGTAHSFSGWLELMALVDELRSSEPPTEPSGKRGSP